MQPFFALIEALDSTTSTNEKIHKIAAYFSTCSAVDGAWALFFLSGRRFKRFISSQKLKLWCQEMIGISDWLFSECLSRVGDSAEAIALLLPEPTTKQCNDESLISWLENGIFTLRDLPESQQKQLITKLWQEQTSFEKFVTNKILTGTFRIGVSSLLTIKGLERAFGVSDTKLHLRLSGIWEPTESFFISLIAKEEQDELKSLKPYPFFLASPLDKPLEALGSPDQWVAEWKWDGIRAQLIYQAGERAIWSRGNELITHTFPELLDEQTIDHSFVLDGEILVLEDGKPRPFADLQKRLGRKKVSNTIIEKYPAHFMIYDLLYWDDRDVRFLPFSARRELILKNAHFFLSKPFWRISPLLNIHHWKEVEEWRNQAYETKTEGLVLKRKDSAYGVGRKRGSWWKYKIDSMTVDAVLLYAQPGSGYRSGLYTDYTFGIWDENHELVPIAKAYSGLTQEEINTVDKWIRTHTLEKFGPVRKVKAELVFEIAFENIQISKRHKSGLALRFPRIKRWRQDKTSDMADHLDDLRRLYQARYL
ncbi:MAG: ATP-dependent DNA ligase [Parachlamydiaceae bacterium]